METPSKPLSVSDIQPGSLIANRYEICERIGSGGMGMVYRVVDRELDNEVVALKLLHPHLAQDETVFRRFRNEVLVARSLSHPNIVRTHDIGRVEDGFSYISMEFVDGVSLKEHLTAEVNGETSRIALPFDRAVAVYVQVLSGMSYAHGKGVIHRDLKPANVMIDRRGEAKLADFGTARIVGMDTSITRAGQVIGTPDYMSPEQIRGEKLDHTCDIYSLGILGYELVVGDKPFSADSPVAVAFKHLNEPLPAMRSPAGPIPDWFEEIVNRATAKKRDERFQSAGEMLAAICERMPEVASASGYFSIDGTSYLRSGTRTGQPVVDEPAPVPTEPAAASPSAPLPPAQPPVERFELGTTESAKAPGWTLDFEPAPSISEERTQPYQALDEASLRSKRAGWGWYVGASVLVLLLAAGIFLQQRTREISLDETQLAALDPETAEAGLTSTDELDESAQDNPDRNELRDELMSAAGAELEAELLENGGASAQPEDGAALSTGEPKPSVSASGEQKGSTAAAGQSSSSEAKGAGTGSTAASVTSKASPSESTSPKPSSVEPIPEEPETETAAASGSSAALAASSSTEPQPTAAPEPSPTAPPAPEPVRGSLALQQGSNALAGGTVDADVLSRITWTGAVTGFGSGGRQQSRRDLLNGFRLNVFDEAGARVVARLEPREVTAAAAADETTVVRGSLDGLGKARPRAGSYRLDLVYDGEVVDSKPLSLSVARLSYSGTRAGAGASGERDRVTIVRGPTYVPGDTSGAQDPRGAGTTTRPPAEAKPVEDTRVAAAGSLATSPNAAAIDAPPAAVQSGLPPAASYTGSSTPGSASPTLGGPTLGGPTLGGPTLGAGVTGSLAGESGAGNGPSLLESYGGTFNYGAVEGMPPERRAFSLRVQFQGESISGSATVAGFPPFRVTGTVYPRGLELRLENQDIRFRLTGARRGSVLRGSYLQAGTGTRGSWEVSKN